MDQSDLTYPISQLLVQGATDHKLPGGLMLCWRPDWESGTHKLISCRRGKRPLVQEDQDVRDSLLAAGKRLNRLVVDLSVRPGVVREGWGATVFEFRLAKQRPLL